MVRYHCSSIIYQAPVVQTLDSATHRINHYPVDRYYGNQLRHLLDSDLAGGQRYPTFEQPGPEISFKNISKSSYQTLFSLNRRVHFSAYFVKKTIYRQLNKTMSYYCCRAQQKHCSIALVSVGLVSVYCSLPVRRATFSVAQNVLTRTRRVVSSILTRSSEFFLSFLECEFSIFQIILYSLGLVCWPILSKSPTQYSMTGVVMIKLLWSGIGVKIKVSFYYAVLLC